MTEKLDFAVVFNDKYPLPGALFGLFSRFLADFGSELDLSESRSMSYPEWLVRADYSA